MGEMIERLRNPVFEHGGTSEPKLNRRDTVFLMREGADEIERLNEWNRRAAHVLIGILRCPADGCVTCRRLAREFIEQAAMGKFDAEEKKDVGNG